jgi:hypothetical protein
VKDGFSETIDRVDVIKEELGSRMGKITDGEGQNWQRGCRDRRHKGRGGGGVGELIQDMMLQAL